ncbi:MAG TPA: hypothetical protein ENO23_04415 [Alphaproteobacteria bacterium]|nr:hypothetical protein [Alphaproteobacteria bacterium]
MSRRPITRATAIAAIVLAAAAARGQTPRLALEPAAATVAPGACCTLSVTVDAAAGSLSCVQCQLAFDESTVRCLSATRGSLYANASFSVFFDWTQPSPDTVLADACVLGYRSYIIAPGELLCFVFEGIATGTSQVAIVSSSLCDIDRVELDHERGNPALLTVGIQSGTGPPPPAPRMWNRPNPFNPSTTIVLRFPGGEERGAGDRFTLDIYDIRGRLVRALATGPIRAGALDVPWDGRNGRGARVDAGVYLAVARGPGIELRRKLVMVR